MKRWIANSRRILLVCLCGAFTGCSFFSQTVAPQTRDRVHAALPIGLSAGEAQANLSGLGFDCTRRGGDYPDENGNDVIAEHYLACVHRPGEISFSCENRDQVFVALAGEVVDRVSVVRGPDCTRQ